MLYFYIVVLSLYNNLDVHVAGQIQFVRQGEATADGRAPKQKAELDRGHDWELRVDLDRKLHVAFYNIVETNLRPDAVLVLVSQQSKTIYRADRAMEKN